MKLLFGSLLQGGRYRILKTLGQGWFGITYLAYDSISENNVAIKEFFKKDTYTRESSSSEVQISPNASEELQGYAEIFRCKFIDEYNLLSSLDHPNIIKAYSSFEENNTVYYTMEYIDGYSICKLGVLDENNAVKYTAQIAEALDYIHKKHITHLDINSENILICDNNATLIDFGNAKQYDESGAQISSYPTAICHGYSPLEQYSNEMMSRFSPTTDIYSLGALLFELLSGGVPPKAHDIENLKLPERLSPAIKSTLSQSLTKFTNERLSSAFDFLRCLHIYHSNMELAKYEAWTESTSIDDIIYKYNTTRISEKEEELINSVNPSKLLDIGCGNGCRIFNYIESIGIDFVGIEKFEKIATSGNGQYIDNIIVKDILTIDLNNLDSRLFDVDTITIFGGSLNGLFSYEDQLKAWSIISHILAGTGSIIFEAYNVRGYDTKYSIGSVTHSPDLPPQFYLSEAENIRIWDILGLSIASLEDYHIPHRNKVRYYILKNERSNIYR